MVAEAETALMRTSAGLLELPIYYYRHCLLYAEATSFGPACHRTDPNADAD